MASGLDAMTGILPVIMVSGVAMKMTERLFPQQQQAQPSRRRKATRRRARRAPSSGFGNFSNLGF